MTPADTIREALAFASMDDPWSSGVDEYRERLRKARAALTELEADRDRWKENAEVAQAAADSAEADRDREATGRRMAENEREFFAKATELLRADRDRLQTEAAARVVDRDMWDKADALYGRMEARALAAESEAQTLRDALEQAKDMCARPPGVCFDAALATPETPPK